MNKAEQEAPFSDETIKFRPNIVYKTLVLSTVSGDCQKDGTYFPSTLYIEDLVLGNRKLERRLSLNGVGGFTVCDESWA